MRNRPVDLTDYTASDSFTQIERSSDLLQALQKIYASRGIDAITIIALRYGMEYSPTTIATILHIPSSQVNQVLRECLQFLKECLDAKQ